MPAGGFLAMERQAAIRDLIADNSFRPTGCMDRELRLRIAVRDNRLVLDIADAEAVPLVRHILSLAPLTRVLRDYRRICDSYVAAAGAPSPRAMEAVDLGR